MKVLVTGGAGFIGRETVHELIVRGHEVVVLDALVSQVHGLNPSMPEEFLPYIKAGSLEFIHGRVEDMDLLKNHLAEVDGLIHLAAVVGVGQSAYQAARYTNWNSVAAASIAETIIRFKPRVRAIVCASSASNYGEGAGWNPRTQKLVMPLRRKNDLIEKRWEPVDPADGLPVDPTETGETYPLQPASIYGLTKRYTESVFHLLAETTGISTACLRYGNVYGPGQSLSNPYTGVLCAIYTRMKLGHPPWLFEDGSQRRSYIYVSDVATANVNALEASLSKPVNLNISSRDSPTLNEICFMIAAQLDSPITPQHLGVARVGDVRHLLLDATCAAETIAFRATTRLQDGLAMWLSSINGVPISDNSVSGLIQLKQNRLLIGELANEITASTEAGC